MGDVTPSVESKKNRTHFDFFAEYELLVSGGKKNKKDVASANEEPKGPKTRIQYNLHEEWNKLVSGGKKGTKAKTLAEASTNHQSKVLEKPLQKKLVYNQSRPQRENKQPNKTLNFGLKRNLDIEQDSNPIKRKKVDSDVTDNSTSKLIGSITINSKSKAKKKLFGSSSSDILKRKSSTPGSHRKRAAAVKLALSQKEIEPCYESDSSDVDHASMSEFLKLENECSTNNISPLSALSNQLQKTNITKQTSKNLMDTINEITVKLENDFKKFNQTYTKGIDEVKNQLLKLEESKSIFYSGFVQSMKELNGLKGSLDKTDVEKIKYICTPKLKSENLRVATLNKNLSKAVNENTTPDRNMREAVKLYNSFKSDLGSPILDRANLQTPLTTSKRYIAVKLQKQCLMLCDTPSKI
ncbi:PREDICTED: uncharacterized protein LOC108563357 [Nicrophorus vespilloides]|uniref:Uncharacterized protein LOC108563357 n=1 Tax=Nicrophorus vespilloides TaxID=110193 RepID=A0ABM1MSF0_NICVS|nr:PREDICTED: uncharacterized protein LOC108563357 [Nicrophorus vespilloides]